MVIMVFGFHNFFVPWTTPSCYRLFGDRSDRTRVSSFRKLRKKIQNKKKRSHSANLLLPLRFHICMRFPLHDIYIVFYIHVREFDRTINIISKKFALNAYSLILCPIEYPCISFNKQLLCIIRGLISHLI